MDLILCQSVLQGLSMVYKIWEGVILLVAFLRSGATGRHWRAKCFSCGFQVNVSHHSAWDNEPDLKSHSVAGTVFCADNF